MVRRLTLGATLAAALVVSSTATSASPSPTGSWVGTLELPRGSQPIAVALNLRGGRATVDLAPGHANRLSVAASIAGARARLALPGRPADVLELARSGATLTGSARQGATVGRVRLRRGAAQLGTYGSYRLAARADARRRPAGRKPVRRRLRDGRDPAAPSDRRRTLRALRGARHTSSGRRRRDVRADRRELARDAGDPRGEPRARGAVPVGRDEPRGHADAASGCRPASRRRARARLRADRRATRASTRPTSSRAALRCSPTTSAGSACPAVAYAGERASEPAIEAVRARRAGRRPLPRGRSRTSIAPASGSRASSQAGWIMPRAAAREPAVRFLVLLVAPAVTQGESDLYGSAHRPGRAARRPRRTIERQVRAVDTGRRRSAPVDPSALDPRALDLRRARPPRPDGALGRAPAAARRRAGTRLHGRGAPQRRPRSRRHRDRVDGGRPSLQCVRRRALRDDRRLAPRPSAHGLSCRPATARRPRGENAAMPRRADGRLTLTEAAVLALLQDRGRALRLRPAQARREERRPPLGAGASQLYATLARLVRRSLVAGEDVAQARRPDKRVFRLTDGRDRRARHLAPRPRGRVDDRVRARVFVGGLMPPEQLAAHVERFRRGPRRARGARGAWPTRTRIAATTGSTTSRCGSRSPPSE